jgi:hypothetical protein
LPGRTHRLLSQHHGRAQQRFLALGEVERLFVRLKQVRQPTIRTAPRMPGVVSQGRQCLSFPNFQTPCWRSCIRAQPRDLTPKSHRAAGCVIGHKCHSRPQGRQPSTEPRPVAVSVHHGTGAARVLRLKWWYEVMPAVFFAANEGVRPVGSCLIIRPRVGGV